LASRESARRLLAIADRRRHHAPEAFVIACSSPIHRLSLRARALWLAALLSIPALPAFAQAPRSPTPDAKPLAGRVATVARGLEHPWALALLADGGMLVTERPGRLRRIGADGKVSEPLAGVPEVFARGQGGLLDVALSPDFARDRLVYLSFSEPGGGGAGTAVARGRLGERGLEDTQVVWRQQPKVEGANHWGSRLVFAPDGTLYVTLGDRFAYREQAQNLEADLGKVVRINPDGSAPRDNPFAQGGAQPDIWSYGHRNIQAAALHPETGQLWTVEHGARGGDELNHPQRGRNYGWPVITYGIDYSGAKIGEGTAKAGMEQPVYYWDPVIAPSGAVFYAGEAFRGWRGNLLVGSLNPGGLVRLVLQDGRVVAEERYRDGELNARIRDVAQGADGSVYLLTDSSDGRVLRLTAAGG
jgi:glucose/arabinose dehydrogenase